MTTAPRLRRRAMGGAATVAAFSLVAACSSGGGAQTEPVSPTTGELDSDVTITYAVQAFAHDALRPIVDQFTAETGIEVVLESGPSTGQDLLTQLVPSFQAGESPYDVIDADDPAGAALMAGGWLMPLGDDVTAAYLEDLSEGMAESHEMWNTKDGQSYRLYHNFEPGYYWVNMPLLEAHGQSVPTTWDELEQLGEALSPEGIYAFADAASRPGLTFVYLAYLTAQAGGNLYEFDEGTRTAFEFAKRLVDSGAFPQDAVTWNYDQSNAAYMGDRVATMRQWPFFADVSRGNTEWFAEEKVTIAAPPAGPAGAKTWAGGWGMAIPKAAAHPAEAAAFVEFMNRPDVAVQLAKAHSFFITARTSVLTEMAGDGLVAHLKEYADNGYLAPRPFHPQAAQAETIVDEVGQAYLTGQMDLDTAMERGRAEIEALG